MRIIIEAVISVAIVCSFAGLLATTVSIVGKMDYEDQVGQRNLYCQMVAEKTWPDYKGIVKLECLPEDKDHGTHR